MIITINGFCHCHSSVLNGCTQIYLSLKFLKIHSGALYLRCHSLSHIHLFYLWLPPSLFIIYYSSLLKPETLCQFTTARCIDHTLLPVCLFEDPNHSRRLSHIKSLFAFHDYGLILFSNFGSGGHHEITLFSCVYVCVCVWPFSSWDMRRVSAPLGAPGSAKQPHIPQPLHSHLEQSSDLMSPTRWQTAV